MANRWGGSEEYFRGDAEVMSKLIKLATTFPMDAAAAAHEEAEIEVTEMARRAPIGGADSKHVGRLRESGRAHAPVTTQEGTEIVISFDTPYAVAQHQRYYEHPQGGQRLFMLSVLEESLPHLGNRLVRRLEARVAGRVR